MQDTIKILIVDDHSMFREGLKSLIAHFDGIEVVGEAGSGEEAVEKVLTLSPDLALMDISMPGMGGLEALRQIKLEKPHVKVVMLTMLSDVETIFEALQSGAAEYILKDACFSELQTKITRVMGLEGKSDFAPKAGITEDLEPCPLTQREKEILLLISQGQENKGIASMLNISENTVKNHISNIFQKLNLSDRTQAVVQALKNHWI